VQSFLGRDAENVRLCRCGAEATRQVDGVAWCNNCAPDKLPWVIRYFVGYVKLGAIAGLGIVGGVLGSYLNEALNLNIPEDIIFLVFGLLGIAAGVIVVFVWRSRE